MRYNHTLQDGVLKISFHGNIIFEDTTNLANFLEDRLEDDFTEAVLDFSEITGITSSAIGAVLDFHQKLNGKDRGMRIKGMSEKAYKVFQYFKLDQLFPIER